MVVAVVPPVLILVTQARVGDFRSDMFSLFVWQGEGVGDPTVGIYHVPGDTPVIYALDGIT